MKPKIRSEPCRKCGGSGSGGDKKCPECKGTGTTLWMKIEREDLKQSNKLDYLDIFK
jgi:DnaJ-class molecular chaperone